MGGERTPCFRRERNGHPGNRESVCRRSFLYEQLRLEGEGMAPMKRLHAGGPALQNIL